MTRTSGRKRTRGMHWVMVLGITVLVLGGFAFFVSGPASTEQAAGQHGMRLTDRSRVCMLQDTVQVQAGLEYEHQGKTYYLCCGGCLAAFQARVEQYSTAVDPVTRARVDKATAPMYAYQGRAYFFASEESLSRFAYDPQRYLKASVH